MLSINITFCITIIFFIYILYKVKNKIDDAKLMMADILLMIASVFGTIGIFNLILSKGFKINIDFFYNSIFFITISIVSLLATYLIYFKNQPKNERKVLWFSSEILMIFGFNIILVGIVYIYLGIGHLPENILKDNFPMFFENIKDPINEEQLYNIRTAANIFILIIGTLSITTGLSLHSFRENKKS